MSHSREFTLLVFLVGQEPFKDACLLMPLLMLTLAIHFQVLASFKIMDYSLLVGIHNLDQAAREKQVRRRDFCCKLSAEKENYIS